MSWLGTDIDVRKLRKWNILKFIHCFLS